ncbi:MAG: hypothetical protein EI684_00255 [Candidatus Viridilinea halotolerans]|uniref:Bacterial Ig-like domain-containing protein n=1 Tax=Candidatus Viridilinea halotolerans TaxID=2491704 RepID=A0A426UC47_9CHLR|nr:MAG: hypothetical protein EI684_00255 [Candidatus Viridilinea halotolerans]
MDRIAPTVTLSSTAPDPTNCSAIPFSATFSKVVTGLVASDISVTNGTVSSFRGSGATYSFTVAPHSAGLVTVSIGANVAHDAVGNGNLAATAIIRTATSLPTPNQPTWLVMLYLAGDDVAPNARERSG